MAESMEHVGEEDRVEYFLFPRLPTVKGGKPVKETLEEFADLYTAHLSSYLVQYIWQNESFSLRSVDKTSGNIPPHIYGCTKYGDNIEDEWFIVFLLNEITKSFPDLVVRVVDQDGEFLLVEMADYLSKWMTPENTEKRVYIYQGSVHILPQPTKSGPLVGLPNGVVTVSDAVSAVREYSVATKCDLKMQRTINRRIGSYPDKIKENYHRTHCYVPANVAALLKARPSLVSAAVQAFYTRDAIDLKACRMMKYCPPETRLMTEVYFTKCLYAQLLGQKFVPDKRVGWNLPPPNNSAFKAHDLGMKLACGFEILISSCKQPRGQLILPSTADLATDLRWKRFLTSLKDKGFFRGELEGSKLHKELLDKAKQFYCENIKELECSNLTAGQLVMALLDSIEVDVEELKRREKNLSPPDDDSWLTITPEQLEEMLHDKFQGTESDSNGHCYDDVANSITNNIKAFVNHQSDYEGAEFPKLRDAPNREKNNRTTFDPDSFADAMTSILDFKLPDWEEGSSSDMSDYSDEDEKDGLELPQREMKTKKGDVSASKMKNYMEQMDRELSTTAVGQSFEKSSAPKETTEVKSDANSNTGEGFEDYRPVDVDLSALCNLLESYNSQQGLAGPASNLLGSMGVSLPQNVDT